MLMPTPRRFASSIMFLANCSSCFRSWRLRSTYRASESFSHFRAWPRATMPRNSQPIESMASNTSGKDGTDHLLQCVDAALRVGCALGNLEVLLPTLREFLRVAQDVCDSARRRIDHVAPGDDSDARAHRLARHPSQALAVRHADPPVQAFEDLGEPIPPGLEDVIHALGEPHCARRNLADAHEAVVVAVRELRHQLERGGRPLRRVPVK